MSRARSSPSQISGSPVRGKSCTDRSCGPRFLRAAKRLIRNAMGIHGVYANSVRDCMWQFKTTRNQAGEAILKRKRAAPVAPPGLCVMRESGLRRLVLFLLFRLVLLLLTWRRLLAFRLGGPLLLARRRLRALRLQRALLLMLLLLALLHALLLLVMLLFQVLELALLLLLHLLFLLLVRLLLCPALAFLGLLLFDALALLVLLLAHRLKLLLMLLLELRIAVRRGVIRWPSRRRPIVALIRPVVAGRPIRLRIRRRRVGPPCVRWAILLIRLHVIGQ